MKKLTKKELFTRLKYFNVSEIKLLKAISYTHSSPKDILTEALSCCSSYRSVIDYVLTWMDTPQGYGFWKYIHDNIDQVRMPFKNQINKIKIK